MRRLEVLSLLLCLLLSSCSYFESCNREEEEEDDDIVVVEEEEEEEEEEPNYVAVPFETTSSGLLEVRASINGMGVNMMFDTGASINTMSQLEAKYLLGKGLLKEEDVIGFSSSTVANGEDVATMQVIVRELKIADRIVLRDVPFSIMFDDNAPLLLGQASFSKFRYEVNPHEQEIRFYDY